MKIQYVKKRFKDSTLLVIQQANAIINTYTSAGYDLTLRQLYYQFVSKDLIPNSQKEYKKLGEIVNSGRLAGLISWEAIIDRTRNLAKNPHWDDPQDFMNTVMPQFRIDTWSDQPTRVEVWIEKDALVGVIDGICRKHDVSYFSCRGYTSQSEMWAASQRIKGYIEDGQQVVVIHLGDHDPSGKDMTRDIEERIRMFIRDEVDDNDFEINRIALNMNQVRKYNPPPNPAKITDSRADAYIREFGRQSWELDALDPKILGDLISNTIESYRDDDIYEAALKRQTDGRKQLVKVTKELK